MTDFVGTVYPKKTTTWRIMGTKSDWDIDLRYGQIGEKYVENLLTNVETVEVKRDKRWIETGNIYIETQCWSDKRKIWYKSGLTTSKATHWAYVVEEMVVMVPIEHLRKVVETYGRIIEMRRSEYSTRGYLITIEDIFKRK
jgi:hypothetical protein